MQRRQRKLSRRSIAQREYAKIEREHAQIEHAVARKAGEGDPLSTVIAKTNPQPVSAVEIARAANAALRGTAA